MSKETDELIGAAEGVADVLDVYARFFRQKLWRSQSREASELAAFMREKAKAAKSSLKEPA